MEEEKIQDQKVENVLTDVKGINVASDLQNKKLTKKDVLKSWLRYYAVTEVGNSYERLTALAFVYCRTCFLWTCCCNVYCHKLHADIHYVVD